MASESGSDISSLLINHCDGRGTVSPATEAKLAKEILAVIYSDFKFKDNMLPETLLTLTMNEAKHTAILDMMKTRQCYANWESEQGNFFNMRRLLNKENVTGTLHGRTVAIDPTSTILGSGSGSGSGSTTFKPNDVAGIKVDKEWLELNDMALLESHTGYFFEEKNNTTHAYRLPEEVPLCKSMHSKYWILVAAAKSVSPSRPPKGQLPSDVVAKVENILGSTAIQNVVKEIIKVFREPTTLIHYWHATYRRLQERGSFELFDTMIHLSAPEICPIVPCFIDALSHVQQLLPPLSKENEYYEALFRVSVSLSASAPEPDSKVKVDVNEEDEDEEDEDEEEEEDEAKPVDSGYMPSDMARGGPPTRWSEVLRDLFKINTNIKPKGRGRH
jgi:hypothetical protein